MSTTEEQRLVEAAVAARESETAGWPGSVDDVVAAADGLPVLFDSGIRSGTDIVKALALGATAVGVGRPYAYGLAIGGEEGLVHVLRSLLAETDLTMAVDGYPSLADLTPDTLRRVR